MNSGRKIFKMIGALAMLVPLASTPLQACVSCYGRSDSPLAVGMNWGIFTLLGVIVSVLATFAGFFIYIIRRQNAFAKAAEQNLSEAKV